MLSMVGSVSLDTDIRSSGARRGSYTAVMPTAAFKWSELMKRDLYAEVTARIVSELERGAAPWIKPWSATAGQNVPCNAASNRPYTRTPAGAIGVIRISAAALSRR
jgi:hypothetical protein